MKIDEFETLICPFMSYRDVGEMARTCRGPQCACWVTTAREQEQMEYDVSDHKGPFFGSSLPVELLDDGWKMLYSPTRQPDGSYKVTLWRYTDILEGECGLTHPREG